jgi:D-hexose-6-phosphate mutarotase
VVLTASDRCFAGTQTDRSGPAVARILAEAGATVLETVVVPDDLDRIAAALLWSSPQEEPAWRRATSLQRLRSPSALAWHPVSRS